ncbi:hypothetical protein H6P81_009363 [Aristolochia fimbriata]|uniref:Uncharacterized protein n=1 Tax=Aristolochia fimbriata TaxID=158543 RepID=A0AAV7EKV0_ARIFI|nr:hypothetical protein H6P81_009363 [Aristolochia fimbriata]
MVVFMGLDEPTITEPPPPPAVPAAGTHSGHRSIGTLLVVLAVITIVGVVAGVFARVCGGRHLAGNGDHDIEGWVERKCRSCIDGGLPPPPPPAATTTAALVQETKETPQAEEAKNDCIRGLERKNKRVATADRAGAAHSVALSRRRKRDTPAGLGHRNAEPSATWATLSVVPCN